MATRIDRVLEIVELGSQAKEPAGHYSLGMRQRLALAAALLGEPRALILDEPSNGLDPGGIRWLRRTLRELARDGTAVLLSSHTLAEVARTADEVIVIHRGRLVAHESVDGLGGLTASGVVVVTPDAERLAAALIEQGAAVERDKTRLLIRGLPVEIVGAVAAEHQVPLHGLEQQRGSLEEAYVELTSGRDEAPWRG